MPEGNPTQTNDTVLDAEQTEEVTAFLAVAIKEFRGENYADSDHLRTHGIEMDLSDHGKDYAIGQLWDYANAHPVDPTQPCYMSCLKLPEEATDEEYEFRELLDELYFKALERVSWHVGMVVTIE
jgi:hypothetical protein